MTKLENFALSNPISVILGKEPKDFTRDDLIRIIKENLKHFKKSKVTLDQADIFSGLPYPDNCFDSIISIAVIYHSTLIGIHNIINEIKRVLKKGGSFFFTTSISVEYSMSVNSGSIYIPIEKGTYFPLDGRERYLCHHYFTKNEIIDLLKDDFKDINIFDDKENYYVTSCIKK
ncbi:TPA: class I SAM-dependent methyltransferase [bacterium]|nr:class I SAM-dependent methyltransferase [bacterium]